MRGCVAADPLTDSGFTCTCLSIRCADGPGDNSFQFPLSRRRPFLLFGTFKQTRNGKLHLYVLFRCLFYLHEVLNAFQNCLDSGLHTVDVGNDWDCL